MSDDNYNGGQQEPSRQEEVEKQERRFGYFPDLDPAHYYTIQRGELVQAKALDNGNSVDKASARIVLPGKDLKRETYSDLVERCEAELQPIDDEFRE